MQPISLFILLVTFACISTISSVETTDHTGDEAAPQCFSKVQFSHALNRDRRASISRPYFQHWRQARDNSRYTAKNLLAFSPRLGKRADHQSAYQPVDLDDFFTALLAQLQKNHIDIAYEDSTMICLSQPITDSFIQQILDHIDRNRRDEEKEEMRGRQAIGKHPICFVTVSVNHVS